MNIVIVGGGGFIGSHLANYFLLNGYSVVVFDRFFSKEKFVDFPAGRISFFSGDMNCDNSLSEVIRKGVDVVLHLASSTTPKSSNDDMLSDVKINLMGAMQLIKRCLDVGVGRFIFASSGGTVYGNPLYLPVDELHPNNPICSYGIVKLAVEKYLGLFHDLYGLSYCALRFSNPYGPGQNPHSGQGVVAAFINKAMSGAPIQVWGDGSVVRDFIYIDDLVDSVGKTIVSDVCGVYNLGSGVGCSINQIISYVSESLNVQPFVEYLPSRNVDVKEIVLDISKGVCDFGFCTKYSMSEGVKRMCDVISG